MDKWYTIGIDMLQLTVTLEILISTGSYTKYSKVKKCYCTVMWSSMTVTERNAPTSV